MPLLICKQYVNNILLSKLLAKEKVKNSWMSSKGLKDQSDMGQTVVLNTRWVFMITFIIGICPLLCIHVFVFEYPNSDMPHHGTEDTK